MSDATENSAAKKQRTTWEEEAETDYFELFGNTADPHQTFNALTDDYNELPTAPVRPHFHEHLLKMKPATQLICFDGCPTDPYHPATMPIYQTATFVQPSASEFGPYDYTRSGNPTRTALETLISGLEQSHSAFAFGSGMAALAAVTRLVEAGQEIIACNDLYGGMYRLLTRVCKRQGIKLKFVDTNNIQSVRDAITPETKLIHIETPSNPLMRITDLRALAKIAHENGALLSVDSTMMSPYLQKPISLGADVVIHSATKYLSGHSDVISGVVCVANETLAKSIAFFQNAEGTALAPFDCWLLLRSIKTLALRVEKAQSNAEKIASFLATQSCIKRLYYAGPVDGLARVEDEASWQLASATLAASTEQSTPLLYPSDKDVKLHLTQSKGGSSVLSFETGSVELSRRIVNACHLFKITVSFGSCNSLIEMPCVLSHASIPADQRSIPEDLVRVSVGIEDVADLIADLKHAFTIAQSDVDDVRSVKFVHHE
eukprot:TRINITY_DN6870_c0_g1_i1.p1 TRINITY_DN6870_c0_g1~~TRINITY_DN6870_c0_g1_i1.p1  ORF type:complete len:489 (-),score=101.71 TRINITY_DN6870_c0_g1_i1:258-1724(-)